MRYSRIIKDTKFSSVFSSIGVEKSTSVQFSVPSKAELKISIHCRSVLKVLAGVGYDNCCITANGDVYPCAGWQDLVLGNVYKRSLKDIWENSERLKELRRITQSSFPECLNCEAMDYCARCLVRNYNESGGDMFAINKHFCEVAFLNKRLVEEAFEKMRSKNAKDN